MEIFVVKSWKYTFNIFFFHFFPESYYLKILICHLLKQNHFQIHFKSHINMDLHIKTWLKLVIKIISQVCDVILVLFLFCPDSLVEQEALGHIGHLNNNGRLTQCRKLIEVKCVVLAERKLSAKCCGTWPCVLGKI